MQFRAVTFYRAEAQTNKIAQRTNNISVSNLQRFSGFQIYKLIVTMHSAIEITVNDRLSAATRKSATPLPKIIE